jgi:hypothetical protein
MLQQPDLHCQSVGGFAVFFFLQADDGADNVRIVAHDGYLQSSSVIENGSISRRGPRPNDRPDHFGGKSLSSGRRK